MRNKKLKFIMIALLASIGLSEIGFASKDALEMCNRDCFAAGRSNKGAQNRQGTCGSELPIRPCEKWRRWGRYSSSLVMPGGGQLCDSSELPKMKCENTLPQDYCGAHCAQFSDEPTATQCVRDHCGIPAGYQPPANPNPAPAPGQPAPAAPAPDQLAPAASAPDQPAPAAPTPTAAQSKLPNDAACQSEVQCVSGVCADNKCVVKGTGAICYNDAQCATGICSLENPAATNSTCMLARPPVND